MDAQEAAETSVTTGVNNVDSSPSSTSHYSCALDAADGSSFGTNQRMVQSSLYVMSEKNV